MPVVGRTDRMRGQPPGQSRQRRRTHDRTESGGDGRDGWAAGALFAARWAGPILPLPWARGFAAVVVVLLAGSLNLRDRRERAERGGAGHEPCGEDEDEQEPLHGSRTYALARGHATAALGRPSGRAPGGWAEWPVSSGLEQGVAALPGSEQGVARSHAGSEDRRAIARRGQPRAAGPDPCRGSFSPLMPNPAVLMGHR